MTRRLTTPGEKECFITYGKEGWEGKYGKECRIYAKIETINAKYAPRNETEIENGIRQGKLLSGTRVWSTCRWSRSIT